MPGPSPIHFPDYAQAPVTKLHLELRTALYSMLRDGFAKEARVGSNQFIYWRSDDPTRSLAPDAFLQFGGPDESFPSWKTWERGAPDVAVEIVNEFDGRAWQDKLADYREIRVRELVRFDPTAHPGARLKAWELLGGELVPRDVVDETVTSRVVAGRVWNVAPIDRCEAGLRLGTGTRSDALLPTQSERDAMRIAELEAELAKRR